MRWIIEGADAENGQDMCITVDADNRIHAETVARKQGILVSSVRRALSPADALEAMFGAPIPKEPGEPMTEPLHPPAPKPGRKTKPVVHRDISASSIMEGLAVPVDYSAPTTDAAEAPAYRGLKSAGIVLAMLCVPAYFAGLASVAMLAINLWHYPPQLTDFASLTNAVMSLLQAGMPIVGGALLHALSGACFALRDIARTRRKVDARR
jgi:hypothetical protein